MSENTTSTNAPEIQLTEGQALMLLPVYAWLTRAETPKGGSARGTASFWSFVGGMRPSIATLVSLHADGLLAGDATVGEDLIPVPDVEDYPSAYVYTQGTAKQAKRFTSRRFHGVVMLEIDLDHPLAQPAGVSVSDLTKWIKAVMPDAMERIAAQREQARKEAEKKAAGELLEKTIADLKAAIEVARKNGVDVTAQEAMLAVFESQQGQQ
ncbi:hypothetical protein [Nonomuraea sp. B19D2]|uniref:hypothetical protein n=1 Tax=Nonomuraea sp. B19D2 TaxID=3159561 RepID=UPI0032DB2233